MRKLLITGVLSIVIGITAAVFSTNLYSIARTAFDLSEQNLTIAQQALDASENYQDPDPRKEEELQKASRYTAYAESDLNRYYDHIDPAVGLTVVSTITVLTGVILLVVRQRRRNREPAPSTVD
jgi:hypothetical protein